jgi:KaiC/GvpD/RAD55 family RecA-like ATPase/mannose-6-phosphate isomerase-like protein (cupin superfamily)
MSRVSSGISDFDKLIDSLYTGDNVVWEVEAGTSYEIFVHNFARQSLADDQNVIYVSFNKSPQSILLQLHDIPYRENFVLLDCFTSGKGKNDKAFMKFYEQNPDKRVIKVEKPFDISHFTDYLNSIEDRFPASKYVFDSLTGMQDLWGDESSTYKFFTYMCPRLYDLGTVAYWILEKEAHSDTFKANLRHITQVVLDLYKRKDKLYIKALKLDGRNNREAFKPHPFEIEGRTVSIKPVKKEVSFEVGTRVKELRMKLGMSQKELAEKVDLTPSFISQLENNQISPSIHSFLTICSALGVSPTVLWESTRENDKNWLITKEKVSSNLLLKEKGFALFGITRNGKVSSNIAVIEPNTKLKKHFLAEKGKELIYVLKGNISAVIDGREEILHEGDSLYLEEYLVSSWKNEGTDEVELLVVCL